MAQNLTEIIRRLLAAARERLPEYTFAQGSENRLRLELVALVQWAIEQRLVEQSSELLPTTASLTGLIAWGDVLGLPRKPATISTAEDALRVTGTTGSSVASGATLVHSPTGLRYQLTEGATLGTPPQATLSLASIDTGSQTRLSAGERLTFEAPPAGINAEAELVADIQSGGEDDEPIEEFRARVLLRFVETGALITATDHIALMLRQPNVVQAYAYPLRAGLGSVDMVALYRGSGAERIPPEVDRVALQQVINDARPIGNRTDYRVLKIDTRTVNVEMTIKARQDTVWDWGGAAPLTVQSWNAGTRTLTFTVARPDSMGVGDRLIIEDVANLNDGRVQVIESLVSSNAVVLTDAPVPAPVTGDLVYAAGSLTQPAREAILAYFAALGPAVGVFGFEPWADSVTAKRLESAVLDALPDVRDCTLVSPEVIAQDPPVGFTDVFTELLIPGRIIVRRAA